MLAPVRRRHAAHDLARCGAAGMARHNGSDDAAAGPVVPRVRDCALSLHIVHAGILADDVRRVGTRLDKSGRSDGADPGGPVAADRADWPSLFAWRSVRVRSMKIMREARMVIRVLMATLLLACTTSGVFAQSPVVDGET